MSKLEESAKGKELIKQFMHYMETDEVGGWRMRRMNENSPNPIGWKTPAPPLGSLKTTW